MKKLGFLFICLIFGLCLVGCNSQKAEKNPKIEIKIDDIEGGAWRGIEVFIICDYSKHPKYDEWMEGYNSSGESYKYVYLNKLHYELVKDKFPNGRFDSFSLAEFLYFTYPSWKELYFDYHNIDLISKEDYVEKVVIHESKGQGFDE